MTDRIETRFSRSLIAIGIAVLFAPGRAFGWGDIGHEAVGEIAERILSEKDPATLKRVHSIIGIEPLYVSATWPDKVRSDQRFDDFAPYHYTTIFRSPTHIEKDITTVFNKFPAILNDPAAPVEARAIALRYIIHLVGDAHQPLHVGNEFDRGGNDCVIEFVRSFGKKDVLLTNLHKLWDTDLINAMVDDWKKEFPQKPYFGGTDVAGILMKKYPEIIKAPADADPQVWLSESAELRKSGGIYPDRLPDDKRPYCVAKSVSTKPQSIPRVGETYLKAGRAVIEKRLVLAGARLAAFLGSILKNRPPPAIDQAKILASLKKRNDPPPTKPSGKESRN